VALAQGTCARARRAKGPPATAQPACFADASSASGTREFALGNTCLREVADRRFDSSGMPRKLVLSLARKLDIMSNMKTATVRQVQHTLAYVISEVQKGQEIAVTKHGKVVARIVPASRPKGPLRWPDSQARMNALTSGKGIKGAAPSEIVRDQRRERI
jgi:prevent-host-death family protein